MHRFKALAVVVQRLQSELMCVLEQARTGLQLFALNFEVKCICPIQCRLLFRVCFISLLLIMMQAESSV